VGRKSSKRNADRHIHLHRGWTLEGNRGEKKHIRRHKKCRATCSWLNKNSLRGGGIILNLDEERQFSGSGPVGDQKASRRKTRRARF